MPEQATQHAGNVENAAYVCAYMLDIVCDVLKSTIQVREHKTNRLLVSCEREHEHEHEHEREHEHEQEHSRRSAQELAQPFTFDF
jgi:hypothetical protein